MKKVFYFLTLFLFCISSAYAQNTIVNFHGDIEDCSNPPVLKENDTATRDILIQKSNPGSNIIVTNHWVICKDGDVVAVVEDELSNIRLQNLSSLQFVFQPTGGFSEFPAGLESGLYEIKLRTCYRKPIGMTQTITTQVDGEVECFQALSPTTGTVCCEILVACINYVDCPDVSIIYSTKRKRIEATVPPGAIVWEFIAENEFGQICVFNTLNIYPKKRGCWTYKIRAIFPNGCESVASLFYCNPQNDPGGLPQDDDGERRLNNPSDDDLIVYPTLFDESINIEIKSNDYQELNIYNSVGQLVFNEKLNGAVRLNLDTQQFESGLYILRITNGSNQAITRKLIKQ